MTRFCGRVGAQSRRRGRRRAAPCRSFSAPFSVEQPLVDVLVARPCRSRPGRRQTDGGEDAGREARRNSQVFLLIRKNGAATIECRDGRVNSAAPRRFSLLCYSSPLMSRRPDSAEVDRSWLDRWRWPRSSRCRAAPQRVAARGPDRRRRGVHRPDPGARVVDLPQPGRARLRQPRPPPPRRRQPAARPASQVDRSAGRPGDRPAQPTAPSVSTTTWSPGGIARPVRHRAGGAGGVRRRAAHHRRSSASRPATTRSAITCSAATSTRACSRWPAASGWPTGSSSASACSLGYAGLRSGPGARHRARGRRRRRARHRQRLRRPAVRPREPGGDRDHTGCRRSTGGLGRSVRAGEPRRSASALAVAAEERLVGRR